MTDTLNTLPDDPHALRQLAEQMARQLAVYEQEVSAKDERIEQLLDYIQLLRQKQFGAKADRLSKEQLSLFDEAELEALIGELEAELEAAQQDQDTTATKPTKNTPKRTPLPAHLTRIERIIDLDDEQKAALGEGWVLIAYETAEQLAVIPRQYYVVATKRAKYAPVNDQVPGADQGPQVAARPPQILPKALGHSSLIAQVVTHKFIDGLPLYRQEAIFAREGIDLSRQTMSGWMLALADPLAPLMAALRRELLSGPVPVMQIDETPLQVLREPGREATQKSYMWVYRGGPPGQPVIWFQYAASRAAEVPHDFLFADEAPPDEAASAPCFYLQSDGYSAYHVLARHDAVRGHMACWAHVRRGFVDAAKARQRTGAAHQMVAMIGKLYQVEREIKALTPDERREARQERARPILDRIKGWLDSKAKQALPKGKLGEAIRYTLNLWPQLTTYLDDGHLAIDNNLTENAIRPFVIGRKGWLFAGSPKGADASAMLYTLVESAKANGLDPHTYLTHIFEHLPRAKTPDAVRSLLPQQLTMADITPLPQFC
ncbi:MAG: IS66 family transposase [Halomonas sp.]|uniref:IS66 family transposase n=1 Tax=Halomonas sp. TaxID=1486246 RepID=UPI001826B2A4|nr:IS66 family transposase [Halomonas sp.]NWN83645.1 IS66 family transposase [Halomonas sp.]